MTTLTIEIAEKDTNILKEFLNKIGAKIKLDSENQITLEIVNALKEIKEIQAGKGKSLSLNDI